MNWMCENCVGDKLKVRKLCKRCTKYEANLMLWVEWAELFSALNIYMISIVSEAGIMQMG